MAIIPHQCWPPSRSYPCNLDALCEFCDNIMGTSAPVRGAGCFFLSFAIQYPLDFVTTQHGLRRVQGIDLMRKYHHRPHHQVHTPDHKRKKPNTNVEPAHHPNVVTSWHIPPGMNTLVHINRTTCITRKTTTTTQQQRKTKQKLKPSLLSLRSAPLCSVRHSPLQENSASQHACPHLPYNHARPVHTPALSAHSNQPHLIHRERPPTCAPPPNPCLVLPRATVVLQAPDSTRKRNNRLEDYSKPEATSTQQARSYAHPKYTQEHIRVSHLYKRWEKNQAQFRPLPIYHKNVSRVECDVCLAPILLPLRPHQRGWKSYHPRLPTPTPM